MIPTALAVDGLSVRFGGVKALTDIALSVREGATCGIIGPNGAGKTTLFNCISGFIKPVPGGRIRFEGKDIVGTRVDRIANLGIARTFQNIALNRTRSAYENILAGLHLSLRYNALDALFASPRVGAAEEQARHAIGEVADLLGLSRKVLSAQVDSLSLGLQKKIEVARAMVRQPRLLLLDEPAGGLNDGETRDLLDSLHRLRERRQLTIVLIDHDMSFVMPLCDQICVLNFGQLIANGTPDEVARDPAVIASYLGEDA